MIAKQTVAFLLATQLAAPLPSQALWFGWGKHSSRMQALQACKKWQQSGPKESYETSVFISKEEKEEKLKALRDKYRKKRNENKENMERQREQGQEVIIDATRVLYVHEESEKQKIEDEMKTVTEERWMRECKSEQGTKQFLGLEKEEVRKHFRY